MFFKIAWAAGAVLSFTACVACSPAPPDQATVEPSSHEDMLPIIIAPVMESRSSSGQIPGFAYQMEIVNRHTGTITLYPATAPSNANVPAKKVRGEDRIAGYYGEATGEWQILSFCGDQELFGKGDTVCDIAYLNPNLNWTYVPCDLDGGCDFTQVREVHAREIDAVLESLGTALRHAIDQGVVMNA